LLGKSIRKRLKEHNWIEATKKDKNPYQTWIRIRKQAESALQDLSLLADHLSNEKQEKLFTYPNVYPFLNKILNRPLWDSNYEYIDFRRTYLAAEIAQSCITKCLEQYKRIEPDGMLAKPLTDKLQESIEICKRIAIRCANRTIK
jgi:hypothetical protein